MDPSGRPSPPEIDVGTVFDRYEIVRHVARGGMGSIWLARFAVALIIGVIVTAAAVALAFRG